MGNMHFLSARDPGCANTIFYMCHILKEGYFAYVALACCDACAGVSHYHPQYFHKECGFAVGTAGPWWRTKVDKKTLHPRLPTVLNCLPGGTATVLTPNAQGSEHGALSPASSISFRLLAAQLAARVRGCRLMRGWIHNAVSLTLTEREV
eukprot:357627-Chlamydomonas_euryale.AAC.9